MQRRDVEPATTPAVPVVVHRQGRRSTRVALLGLQPPGLLGVGCGGVDDLQHPTPQDPQCLGVELCCPIQQEVGRRCRHPRLDVVGKRIHRAHDHARLVGAQLSGRQSCPDPLVVLQHGSQTRRAMRLGPSRTRRVGPPVGGRRRPRVRPRVDGLTMAQDPHQELVELRTRPCEVDQHLPGLDRRQRPQRRLRDRRQLLATPGRESRDPVLVGVRKCRHGSTLPEPTDTGPYRQNPCGEGRFTVDLWTQNGPIWRPGLVTRLRHSSSSGGRGTTPHRVSP